MRATVVAILIALVVPAGPAGAQSKAGTTMAAFLGIEPISRCAGMGNAGAALSEGIESVYFNAGAIGTISRPAILFTHSLWYADITYDYAAAALPVRTWGTLFASVTTLGSGEINVRTVEQPLGTGERYTVGDLALTLGYGRQVTERFTAGFQVNWVRERIWNTSSSFTTFSAGTVYRLTESGIRLGSFLSNLGTESGYSGRDLAIQYDNNPGVFGDNSALPGEQFTGDFPVPILARVGLAIPWAVDERSRLLFLLDALHPNDNTESVNAGAEWAWKETLALRMGYQTLFQDDSDLGLTFGFGLQGGLGDNRYHLDYAWADHEFLQETHRMTLVLDF